MKNFLTQFSRMRLRYILVVGFVLTAAITIAVSTRVTYGLINSYLEEAQDSRVGRDMDLAEAFYNNKLTDISATAGRIASVRSVKHNLSQAAAGDPAATGILDEAVGNEIASLPLSTQRFIVLTDALGHSITGLVAPLREGKNVVPGVNWSDLPIVTNVLAEGQPRAATEVIPAYVLVWVDLAEQARIDLIDTPKAASDPFDPREGSAGLALVSVAPITDQDDQIVGSVLVGHLFNNDFTLVDRIKEVAGVDTVTIFFGDLRVSTNVEDKVGQRAIGTRVSQEVRDVVLERGQEFTGPAYVVNQWYITRYEPLYNHEGEVVGSLYVGAKQAAFQRLVDSFRGQVFLIAGASILLALLIAGPMAWSISRPLAQLAGATQQVAEGDWSVRVPPHGYTEMRVLAEAFNTMVGTLQETQEQLLQKEKLASVGQLAAGVAHEINNPLGSVLLYADILHKETPDDNPQQQKDLEMILREANRCKTIVNDLLDFSRQNEVLVQPTDTNSLLQELVEVSCKKELYQAIEIVSEFDPELPLIQADPFQIRQVIINLMNNAAEAMPQGGRLTLRTRQGPAPGVITVEVQDTGHGITEEHMKKIFTPFFTTKPIGQGTGLGLAIIYGIVKMHQGQIRVESQVDQGTQFTITLREKLPSKNPQPDTSFVIQ